MPPREPPVCNEALRGTLVQMGQQDQAEIQQSYADEHAPSHARQRVALLKQIVAEFGWPGVSLSRGRTNER